MEYYKKIKPGEYIYRNIYVNISAGVLKKDGIEVYLTPREFKLAVFLIMNRDVIRAKGTLMQTVWNDKSLQDTRVIDNHIRQLREKLDWKDCLVSFLGYGYQLV